MANLDAQIEAHLGRKVDFTPETGEVELWDDGDGVAYIKSWSAPETQPTAEQLTAADGAATTAEALKTVQITRASKYPSIGDQLDMLWHAVDTGDWTAAKVKTTSFYTELKAVKDANPKPQQEPEQWA